MQKKWRQTHWLDFVQAAVSFECQNLMDIGDEETNIEGGLCDSFFECTDKMTKALQDDVYQQCRDALKFETKYQKCALAPFGGCRLFVIGLTLVPVEMKHFQILWCMINPCWI